jgi:hypothetical protein
MKQDKEYLLAMVCDSVSIIDLRDNSVTNVPLAARSVPTSIAFDEAGQRVFTGNGL